MRVAALDLGTNTILCLIADVVEGQIQSVVFDHIWFVRLGQDVNRTKRFHPEALQRARQALSEAAQQIHKTKVTRVLAVATSAARDVSNQEELHAICRELGIPLQIISGPLEAELTFGGATQTLADTQGCAVIDVGGGSTEFILKSSMGLQFQSINIGSVRVTEKFFTDYPIECEQLEQARQFIREQLQPVHLNLKEMKEVIGVAGTPTTLAAVQQGIGYESEKINQSILTLTQLDHWLEVFAPMLPAHISDQYKIEPKRADVLVAGILVLRESLAHLHATQMTVSTKGVRDGVAVALERQLL